MLGQRRRQADSRVARLTPRERETLALVAQGQSNGAIAGTMGITRRAVERHINAIFSKLELTDPVGKDRRVTAALLYLAEGDGAA